MFAMVDSRVGRSFSEVALDRRSIRRFQPRSVPEALIERLLEAAIWAPSPHNRQPWRFVVLDGPAEKQRLATAMGDRLRADRLADGDNPKLVEADAGRSYARITESPLAVLAFVTMEAMDSYPDARRSQAEYLMAVQAVAMSVENLLLAAEEAGLGACWMCAPLFCSDTVVEVLGLPSHWQAQALVTVGFPGSGGKPARRHAVGEVVFRPPH